LRNPSSLAGAGLFVRIFYNGCDAQQQLPRQPGSGDRVDERHPHESNRGSLRRFTEALRDARGVDLGLYRPRYLERRIATRLQALGLLTYRQYLARLAADPAEFDRLMSALTINVTQFFRDPSTFESLRKLVVPTILEQARPERTRTVRVWSAGCATGQEAYSITMCLLAAGLTLEAGFALSVLGTDIDPAALERARRAEYTAAETVDIPLELRSRFTEPAGEGCRLTAEVTSACRFVRASLFESAPVRGCDIVLCRNVFIYLRQEQQLALVERFRGALRNGGVLVLGRSERLHAGEGRPFEVLDARERIYRKV
jgi:chemotaxis methyl-accepting protein methylase